MGQCDCIASGNPNKPKQHGADPHAKNCAVYLREGANIHGIGPDEGGGPNPDYIPDTFTSPESTSIAGADYDANTRTLYVRFTNGKTYRGQDFPAEAWRDFVQASSKGSHFNRRIRPLYLMKPTA